jgi:hypothetical protein
MKLINLTGKTLLRIKGGGETSITKGATKGSRLTAICMLT